jgi:hypothetical protein
MRELDKHQRRIKGIIERAKGDEDKEIQYARAMCKSILTFDKALERGLIAREMGKIKLYQLFIERAHQLNPQNEEVKFEYKKVKISVLLGVLNE